MCLSTDALILFLNLIGLDMTTAGPNAITVHATSGDVHWYHVVDEWCTAAPYTGRDLPFVLADARPLPLR